MIREGLDARTDRLGRREHGYGPIGPITPVSRGVWRRRTPSSRLPGKFHADLMTWSSCRVISVAARVRATIRPPRRTIRSAVPLTIALPRSGARIATRSAGEPWVTVTSGSRMICRPAEVTAVIASVGVSCAAMRSAAVSSGSAWPIGPDGSCRLSPPAATCTPASSRSRTAARPRGAWAPLPSPGGASPDRGSVTTPIPASASDRAACRRSGTFVPRLTTWLAVTG